MKTRYSEEQIIRFLKEAEAPIKELSHRHVFSEASYYHWHNKFGGMEVWEAKRLLAESLLENALAREALREN